MMYTNITFIVTILQYGLCMKKMSLINTGIWGGGIHEVWMTVHKVLFQILLVLVKSVLKFVA